MPGLPLLARGKVRDVYAVGDDALLLVATDRISAFDVVMGQGIPDKGRVLTQLSVFWFGLLADVLPNHLLTANDDEVAAKLSAVGVDMSDAVRATLSGRAMLCKRTTPLPIEAVVRGYLSGSGWKEYRDTGPGPEGTVNLWGVPLPAGLRESDRLPEPIFTPSTKATAGHDEPMQAGEAAELLGPAVAGVVERKAKELYSRARDYAAERGILIADTKFEFGVLAGTTEVILIDEALTPDSSRFWDAAAYEPGRGQASFDKQFVRDYLETVPGWDKCPPAPDLPPDVILRTAAKYRDAYRRLTGRDLPDA